MASASITFHGGAGTVTGSNFLLEAGSKRLLIDCGLFQGSEVADTRNRDPFAYDPASIDALLVTHAHLDHVGRIPILVKAGFAGRIYSTAPTKEVARLILEDSMRVLAREAQTAHAEPLYGEDDVRTAMALWETVPYHTPVLLGEVRAEFRTSGHVLGSAMIVCTYEGKNIVFTGDLGNSPTPLLPDTETLADADYLVMESVYGDRLHEDLTARKERLRAIIERIVATKGVLVIPAFSFERTQELLYEIETMVEGGVLPVIPVFIDSPLAIKITDVYKRHEGFLNAAAQERIKGGNPMLAFRGVHFTMTREESQAIASTPGPKIVIAGSGMSNGGRILIHEKQYVPHAENTLLIAGYQAPGSLGRQLEERASEVMIDGEKVNVRARLEVLTSYSSHPDADGLTSFVEPSAGRLRQVYLAMGEPRAALTLAQRLREYLDVPAVVPRAGERVELMW